MARRWRPTTVTASCGHGRRRGALGHRQPDAPARAFNKGRLATQDNYIRGGITPESPVFFRARASGLTVADWQNVILVKENGRRFYNELDSSYDGYFAHAMAWTGDPRS